MLSKVVCSIALIATVSMSARAGADVDYQFDVNVPSTNLDFSINSLDSIKIQDRVWATPGIEQAIGPEYYLITHSNASDWIPAPESSGLVKIVRLPEWLDDAVWPRSREMWGAGYYRPIGGDSRMIFQIGSIGLQR